ncbi:MAG: sulfite exporter TauE/SafE family protein [Bauldia sp.]|nr:sulfite exporter TauE/SafE family protein [Bauldia sp.]
MPADFLASPATFAALFAALLAAGAVSGLLAGLFGVGGGAVLVPVLYECLGYYGVDDDIRMHISVATSVAVIIPTSIRSFLAHRKIGAVDMDLLRRWTVVIPLGAIAAGLVAGFISGEALRGIFAFLATLIALKLLFGGQWMRLGSELPGEPARALVGFLIGLFSTLMGIGGGVFNNTFMTLYGRSMHQAVATSSGIGVLISIPGVIGFVIAGWGADGLPAFSLGYVNLLAVVVIMPVTLFLAPYGARLAHRLSRRQLEAGFGLFLLIVATRFTLSLFED